MSYILEALKKSEQERGHGGSPGIQTIHSSSLNYHTSRKPLWPWLLFAILCVNLAMLVYFMLSRPDGDAGIPAPAPVATTQAPPRKTPTVRPQQLTLAPTPQPPAKTIVAPPPPTPVVAPPPRVVPMQTPIAAAAPVATPVIEIDELPPDVASHVPHMEFSAHVYSSNPKQRSVVINDMFLEEGELLSTDLKLSEITPDGVIFEFRGYRFHRSVLAGWE
jgi:general secretion pathway protein B